MPDSLFNKKIGTHQLYSFVRAFFEDLLNSESGGPSTTDESSSGLRVIGNQISIAIQAFLS